MWPDAYRWRWLPLPIALVAIALATAAVLWGDRGSPSVPSATPDAGSGVVIAGNVVQPLAVQSLGTIPAGMSFVVGSTPCVSCDALPTVLRRVSRDADGLLRIETLLEAGDRFDAITSVAVSPEDVYAASACRGSGCGGNLVTASTTILRSTDGGATWQRLADLPGIAWASEFDGTEIIVSWTYQLPGMTEPVSTLVALPSFRALVPPAGAFPGARPTSFAPERLSGPRLFATAS